MVLEVNHTHDVIASSVKTALARFGIGEYNPDNSKDTVGDEVVCIRFLIFRSPAASAF